MSITWRCECGKSGRVPDEKGGKKGKCPACGSVIHIPHVALAAPAPPPPPPPIEQSPFDSETFEVAEPAVPVRQKAVTTFVPPPVAGRSASTSRQRTSPASPALSSASGAARRRKGRDYLYLLTLLALIPLGISLFRSDDGGVADRLAQTVKKHPEIGDRVQELVDSEKATLDELFNILPGHRLDGSFLARDTWWHWAFALLSAAAFMGLMVLMFPPGHTARTHLLWTGVFTATAGILVLIAFQFFANATEGMWLRGRSIIVLLFYIVKFIGFSYRCADDPANGFLLSFMGFTLGVGLCEEIVKAIPVMWHFKTYGTLKWRAACLWGFASGVGFGVAEGIMYSSRYYNGMTGGDMYVVRFVSCVALHAVWSASVGIFLWKHQNLLDEAEGFLGFMVNAAVIVSAPMLLHGAYDTLLKKDMNSWALLVAVISFAWLAFQIETARRRDPDDGDAAEEEDEGRVVFVAPPPTRALRA
jgi:RsiW-degrading membrane proteinase PrsW (M82 family)